MALHSASQEGSSQISRPEVGSLEGSSDEIAVKLVHELARRRENPSAAPPVQLHEYIDLEALNVLCDHAREKERAEWELELTVEEFEITVDSEGQIEIE